MSHPTGWARLGGRAAVLALSVLLAAAAPAAGQTSGAAASGDVVRFDVLEYRVEGNSVLPVVEVERAVYPHLGPGRTLDDVEGARAALEDAYHRAGFLTVLVNIPEQKVAGGVVVLEVVEATVDRLRVSGTRYWSAGYIRKSLGAVREGEVPNFPDVQRDVANFNQQAGRSLTPVLKAGAMPGTVEIEAKVSDASPLHGSVEINNRQTLNTEPLRLSASLRHDNLWGRDHSISFLYLAAPENPQQVRVMSGNYVARLPGSPVVLALYGILSRSNVASVGGITVVGDANIAGLRAIAPLRSASDAFTHSFSAGIDYKDFLEDLRFAAGTSSQTPITYMPVALSYSAARQGMKGVTRGSLGATMAPRGALFGNEDAEFEKRRSGARANFAVLRAELSRLQTLPAGHGLYGRVVVQTASGPVINTEQFYAGGVDTVRGYFEAEAAGDDAGLVTAEWRSPSAAGLLKRTGITLTAHAFADAAVLRIKQPLPEQQTRFELWSVGFGLRVRSEQRLAAAVDFGVPMHDAQVTRRGDPRLHARVAYEF